MKQIASTMLFVISFLAVTACMTELRGTDQPLERNGYLSEELQINFINSLDSTNEEWGRLYPFREDGLGGYKDAYGNVVIEPKYLYAEEFFEELAFVRGVQGREEQTGFVGLTGEIVIPLPLHHPAYFFTPRFSDGFAPVIIREWECENERILLPTYGLSNPYPEYNPGPFVFIDRAGQNIFGQEFLSANEFSEGLAFVRCVTGMDEQTGYIDITGSLVIPLPAANFAGRFSEGFAHVSVRMWDRTVENPNIRGPLGPFIFIDRAGQNIFEQEFLSVRPFEDGIARVSLINGNAAFIDRTGKNAFGIEFRELRDFENGYAMVVLLDGTRTRIDRSGNIVGR